MKRRPHDEEKELADRTRLLRAWCAFHAEQLTEALASAHGMLVAELMTVLDRLELSSAAALLNFIQRNDWSSVSYGTRLVVLHQINARITHMRKRNGMAATAGPAR
jgi:hypothetical protein